MSVSKMTITHYNEVKQKKYLQFIFTQVIWGGGGGWAAAPCHSMPTPLDCIIVEWQMIVFHKEIRDFEGELSAKPQNSCVIETVEPKHTSTALSSHLSDHFVLCNEHSLVGILSTLLPSLVSCSCKKS